MPGSTVPETVPSFMLRLDAEELDLHCRWLAQVMRQAGLAQPSRLAVLGVLYDVTDLILTARPEPILV